MVEIINYPIDTNTWQVVQDFAVASPRHQGRFHTGEDWFGGAGATLGQPVRAAAAGRVTYSAPTGWGRDGGVVIIEHTLSDGTVFYTQYGHMMETDVVKFPARLSCVAAGDVIGAVGDARPAPHLHFEMRVSGFIGGGDNPGPGYTRPLPEDEGFRRPMEMLTNLQLQLTPAYAWNTTTSTYGPLTPPLVLEDNSLMVIDGEALRRITPDGRVLWRVPTEAPAVSITGFQGNPLIVYADGTVGRVDFEGVPGASWQVGFSPRGEALTMGEFLLFHTTDNALVALSENRREVLWRLEGVPPYARAFISPQFIALVIAADDAPSGGDELWLIARSGEVISRSELSNGADMATTRDGDLVVYTQGGLWRVDAQGDWSELMPEVAVPPGGGSSAVLITEDGRTFLLDGENIYAYTRINTLGWQASLPQPITGQARMAIYDDVVLIASNHGHLVSVKDSGGICGFTRLYGDDRANLWFNLGADGLLRVAVGDQIVGLNWERFTNGC
ncbi:MAG: hypothetical protein OHK0046_13390 [Anaerolineae bacterium]